MGNKHAQDARRSAVEEAAKSDETRQQEAQGDQDKSHRETPSLKEAAEKLKKEAEDAAKQ